MAEPDKALKGQDRPVTESLNKLTDRFTKTMHTTADESLALLERQIFLGFAVVAEAVRNLAQRSSTSAKGISELIKNSVSKG